MKKIHNSICLLIMLICLAASVFMATTVAFALSGSYSLDLTYSEDWYLAGAIDTPTLDNPRLVYCPLPDSLWLPNPLPDGLPLLKQVEYSSFQLSISGTAYDVTELDVYISIGYNYSTEWFVLYAPYGFEFTQTVDGYVTNTVYRENRYYLVHVGGIDTDFEENVVFNLSVIYDTVQSNETSYTNGYVAGFDYGYNTFYNNFLNGAYSDMNGLELFDFKKLPQTYSQAGVSFTNNYDGSFTINGTSTLSYSQWELTPASFTVISGHKYAFVGNSSNPDNIVIVYGQPKLLSFNVYYRNSIIVEGISDGTFTCYLRCYAGTTYIDDTISVKCYDLTAIFGAGNEPMTIDDLLPYLTFITSGYNQGFYYGNLHGIDNAQNYSFLGLLGSIFDAPITALRGLFDFDILGFNMWSFVQSLFTICIIIVILRYVVVR